MPNPDRTPAVKKEDERQQQPDDASTGGVPATTTPVNQGAPDDGDDPNGSLPTLGDQDGPNQKDPT